MSVLTFKDLGSWNWNKYEEFVLRSETNYPESIRTPREEFIDTITKDDAVAKVALLDSRYVGNAIGFCLDEEDLAEFGLLNLPEGSKVAYLFNLVIDPRYQGKGYGCQLLWNFIETARARGYSYLAGHFRPNGSLHLIRKFGAQEMGISKNWENMGEDYVFCFLDIQKVALPDLSAMEQPKSKMEGPVLASQRIQQPKFTAQPDLQTPVLEFHHTEHAHHFHRH